ncbi:response regulator [Frankia sp. ACN1ag]|uniref:response regulator n=1 Tax=Frankia sp. ACN1ag TaxID=102891 RepID=UPI0006DC4BAC|nr:response regulator [Frankia sp. ACN1ag]
MSSECGREPSRRLLLVDDDAVDVALLHEALHEGGYPWKVHVVRNAERALDLLAGLPAPPDAILLDLHSPGGDAEGFVVQARRRRRLRNILIIVLTASGTQDLPLGVVQRSGLVDAGCVPMAKPDDFEGFLALAREIDDLCVAADAADRPWAPDDPDSDPGFGSDRHDPRGWS